MHPPQDITLADLHAHKLSFASVTGKVDPMARNDDADQYVVLDPLLEKVGLQPSSYLAILISPHLICRD